MPDLRSAESGRGDETTPCHGIAIAPDGKSLWINSTVDNAVFAYSLPDLRLLGHVLLPVREKSGQPPISATPNWIYVHARWRPPLRLQLGARFSVRDRCHGDEADRRRGRRQCAEAPQYVGVALDQNARLVGCSQRDWSKSNSVHRASTSSFVRPQRASPIEAARRPNLRRSRICGPAPAAEQCIGRITASP